MDTQPWQSSATRYYAFDGEKLGLLDRIAKPHPVVSTRASRSPPFVTSNHKSAPTSPVGSSTSRRSSLLDRISPKGYSPHAGDLPPLSPELGDHLDLGLDEEEEQVIRVLDNNQELVYQRECWVDERLDREGEVHESRNSSPVKKRKLVHPNQSTNEFTPPTQNKPSQKASKRTRSHSHSHSRSPPNPQPTAASPAKKRHLASRLGVDWSSGSAIGGGSAFGKRPGLTFGFAGYGYETSAEVNTARSATLRDRIKATHDLHDDPRGPRPPKRRPDARKPSPPSVQRGRNSGEETGGTSLLRRIGSCPPISDPELEAPREGGEDHASRHEADYEWELVDAAFSAPIASPPVLLPQPDRLCMDSPLPLHDSPPQTPSRERLLPDHVPTFESVASSRSPPPESGTPSQAEAAAEEIKSMEQHAEDFLQDIRNAFLSKTSRRSTEPAGVVPGSPAEDDDDDDDAFMSPHDRDAFLRGSFAPTLDGISPPARDRSISPFLYLDHRDLTSDAMSISSHTPRSTAGHLPTARSTSFPASDLDPNDTLLKFDPEVDQITKQALADLIVHSLKLNHSLGMNDGWENSDVVRGAIKQEVDQHARDFLRLAAKLARRMDSVRDPHEVLDVVPDHLMPGPTLSDTTENGHLEVLSPAENDEELPSYEEDAQHAGSDVEMGPVPREISQSPEESRTEDEPAVDQELHDDPSDEHLEHVDHPDHIEYADESASQEPGLEIPGVWCARTGKDRSDTIHERIEVSEDVAARARKRPKGNAAFGGLAFSFVFFDDCLILEQ